MLARVARLGPYELLERVGVGGMAEVYKARQLGEEGFERHLAVKRILPGIASDPDFVAMFIDEAKIAVQLQHPNIAQIYDLGRDGEELFIALEYIEGRDMKTVVERQRAAGKPLPLSFAIYVVLKVCEALQHAHFARGSGGAPLNFIHRDISPQNILVSYEGAVKVIDFGLAKAAGRLSQTQAGVVKGKLAYLSSEQARGQTIDHRSDLFSLGTCLFEWLTGERLFWRTGDMETVIAVQKAEVPPLRAVRPELPAELQTIVGRALTADPNHRYGSASEMHEALMVFAVEAGVPIRRQVISRHLASLFPESAPAPVESIRPPGGMETARPRARGFQAEATRALPLGGRVSRDPGSGDLISVSADDLIELVEDDVSAVPIVEHDSSFGAAKSAATRSVSAADLFEEASADWDEPRPERRVPEETGAVRREPHDWSDENTVQLTAEVVGGYLAQMRNEPALPSTPRPPPRGASGFEDDTQEGAYRSSFDDDTIDGPVEVDAMSPEELAEYEEWPEADDGPSDTDHEGLRGGVDGEGFNLDEVTFVHAAIPAEFLQAELESADLDATLPLRPERTQPSIERPAFERDDDER